MPTTTVSVDPADVAIVEAALPRVRAMIADLKALYPAVKRLAKTNYPGAHGLQNAITSAATGDLRCLMDDLEALVAAHGDYGAYEYNWYVRTRGLSLAEASAAMFDCYGTEPATLDRIEALKKYATTREALAEKLPGR